MTVLVARGLFVVLVFLCSRAFSFTSFLAGRRLPSPVRLSSRRGTAVYAQRGKIAVTGVGEREEDEFLLNLLNEQNVWSSVILGTADPTTALKRFLTRSARYSGLLNVLDFASTDSADFGTVESILGDCEAWLALNVPRDAVVSQAERAVAAGVRRAVFTVELPAAHIKDTAIAEFDFAAAVFEAVGGSFTGIRHGRITEGSEDRAYEIVNASTPLVEGTVERGVLARVATELLRIDGARNTQCGVSSAGPFAAAYLNILRSSGLSRQQEVQKVFSGGIQRVADLTAREREAEALREVEKQAAEKKRVETEAFEASNARAIAQAATGADRPAPRSAADLSDSALNVDFDLDPSAFSEDAEVSEETLIAIRANEILTGVWMEMSARMYSKSTSKAQFFESNMNRALDLADKELQAEKDKEKQAELRKNAILLKADHVVELERQQYAKLLSLERRELQDQKQMSDTWVKYIYLLLERTLSHCASENVLFYTLDEVRQTLLLRTVANELRARCHLPSFDAVYDPLDAAEIVRQLSRPDAVSLEQLHLTESAEVVGARLQEKYGDLLQSVPALKAAAQILNLALDTIRLQLPPPSSPSPSALSDAILPSAAASSRKSADSKARAHQDRKNGNPFAEEESVVENV